MCHSWAKASKKQVCLPRVSFPHLDADSEGDGRAAGQKEARFPSLGGAEPPAGQEHPLGTATRTVNKLLLP